MPPFPDFDPTKTGPMPGGPTPDPDPDSWVGRSLGEYRLIRRLGRGGMGLVYLAEQTFFRREVAVKILTPERIADPQAIARLKVEMIACGQVTHPQIVQALHAGESGGILFLVMERLDGADLGELLKARGPLRVADACEAIRQAALGLQCVADAGLVHRDLKPSNLFLTLAGVVKVLDLGLAKVRDETAGAGASWEQTPSGLILGTLDYMAPEQWNDPRHVDTRADLYSLGCTLYALLAGEPPFPGRSHPTITAKMAGHLFQTPPSIRDRRPDVGEALAALLDRLLAKDRDDRFAAPRDLAEALRPFCDGADLAALVELEAPTEPILTGRSPDPSTEPHPARWPETIPHPTPVPPTDPAPDPGPTEPRDAVVVDEDVQFTVYRPDTVAPETWATLLVFTHLATKPPDAPPEAPEPIEEVKAQALGLLGPHKIETHRKTTQDSVAAVPRDEVLTLVPIVEGLTFNPQVRMFCWSKVVHREEFLFRASRSLDGKVARGRLSVYLGSILLAEVALKIRVDSKAPAAPEVPPDKTVAGRFRRIFGSYAESDREVAAQFERLARSLGDEYLSRCVSLRAGESCDDRLRQLIEGADVFQLFWSRNALASARVEAEWRHALALNRDAFIRPVYWEDPLPDDPARDLPPDALKRLHFQKLDGVGPVATLIKPGYPGLAIPGNISGDLEDGHTRAMFGAAITYRDRTLDEGKVRSEPTPEICPSQSSPTGRGFPGTMSDDWGLESRSVPRQTTGPTRPTDDLSQTKTSESTDSSLDLGPGPDPAIAATPVAKSGFPHPPSGDYRIGEQIRSATGRWARLLVALMPGGLIALAFLGLMISRPWDTRPPTVTAEPPTPPLPPVAGYQGYLAVENSGGNDGYPKAIVRADETSTPSATSFALSGRRLADGRPIYLPRLFDPDPQGPTDGYPAALLRDDLAMRLVFIEGGEYLRGNFQALNRSSVVGLVDDEPLHHVIVSSFYMGESEVTNGQILAFLRDRGIGEEKLLVVWRKAWTELVQKVGETVAERYPAVGVPRRWAEDFARWIGGRLPTEAEWEFAARSQGQDRIYVAGDEAPPPGQFNIHTVGMQTAEQVKGRPDDRTDQGLFDMTGNVSELCSDLWAYYEKAWAEPGARPLVDPTGPFDTFDQFFVVRGGSFASRIDDGRTFARRIRIAEDWAEDHIGFRVVVQPIPRPDPGRLEVVP